MENSSNTFLKTRKLPQALFHLFWKDFVVAEKTQEAQISKGTPVLRGGAGLPGSEKAALPGAMHFLGPPGQ